MWDEELNNSNQELTDGAKVGAPINTQELIVSNPLTPSKVELMKQDEKSPRENALQGYKKLNGG